MFVAIQHNFLKISILIHQKFHQFRNKPSLHYHWKFKINTYKIVYKVMFINRIFVILNVEIEWLVKSVWRFSNQS